MCKYSGKIVQKIVQKNTCAVRYDTIRGLLHVVGLRGWTLSLGCWEGAGWKVYGVSDYGDQATNPGVRYLRYLAELRGVAKLNQRGPQWLLETKQLSRYQVL